MYKRVLAWIGSHAPPGSRRWWAALVPAAIVVYLFGTTVYVQSQSTYYRVVMDGRPLGYVAGQETVGDAVALAERNASREYGFPVRLANPPALEQIITHERYETLSLQALAERLQAAGDFLTRATVLVVDGQEVAVLPSKEAAQSVLDELKARYARRLEASVEGGRLDVRRVTIQQSIRLEERDDVPADRVRDAVDVLAQLMGGKQAQRVHVVRAGESPWTIASAHGMTVAELLGANPGVDPQRLQPGQELRLNVPEPWISFESEEVLTVTERIPFATRREYDANLDAGKQRVKQEGEYGEKQITYALRRRDSRIVEQRKVEEQVTRQPVDRILVIGTKPVAGVSTGRLIWPLRGRITSGYGPRWGAMHTGIDIDGATGQAVRAADGGTVVSAGWDGGYGYAVQIRHDSGLYTFYAHMSRIAVDVGDAVAQGQVIGYVGSTGQSTGSHLHFEVRRCTSPGCAVPPLGFLP
ncbi:LysM peptidoglycan-binding domain-containing protein [Thermaerobacter sp. FW80]|uniref:peptidoglycan DD-metalloendopeptidase family protein n=1 Tax=Thermaerobacter sp. FW80 TaxID=2546351 RepID=UPI0010751CB3|nr:peptidoglycan DD-metalloendopeptidase family protein [Thermaerobacter sp. FW80]QBS37073.1 LysM peptidoglycan-binding domain-containing protein [Thermaerobacter sp. FW80]